MPPAVAGEPTLAERVLQLEALISARINRHQLRPDIYPPDTKAA